MGWSLKRKINGSLCRTATVQLCACGSGYTVIFPQNDIYSYQRTYALTESGGVYIGGGLVNLIIMGILPFDLAWPIGGPMFPIEYSATISIEMTIDQGTGERSVRTIVDVTAQNPAVSGVSDYTEVFASGSTFNLSASSITVRPVTLL